MSVELDNAFQQRRIRLRLTVERAVASLWNQGFHNREQIVAGILPIVNGGTQATAALVDAFMVATLREAGEAAQPKGTDPTRYTVSALRGTAAEKVYERPFGALGAGLAAGRSFADAFASSSAYVQKLAATDLQLAHSHAALDWMADDRRIGAYKRVLGPGKNCSLCRSASTRVYHKADLMPIHEHCHCSVSPVLGDFSGSISFPDDVKVVSDPELGARLADPSWNVAA